MIYIASYAGMLLMRLARARAVYGLLLGLMFLFSAFRYEVGCDWFGYQVQFDVYARVPLAEVPTSPDPVWTLLILAQDALGLPYPWLNVLASALFFLGAHRLARRQPDALGFLVLLFPVLVLNMPMSGIRQGAAIGVICLAFNAFTDRRMLRYVALVLLATGIHASAAIFLLLAPLAGGGLTRARLALAAVLAVPGAALLMGSEAAEVATTRYVAQTAEAAGAAYRIALLTLTAIPFLLFWRRVWRDRFPEEYRLAMIGALAMLALPALLPLSSVIADRAGYYFIPIQAMILARLPWLRLGAGRPLIIAAPYLVLMVVLMGWALMSGLFQACYLPYRSWIFGLPPL